MWQYADRPNKLYFVASYSNHSIARETSNHLLKLLRSIQSTETPPLDWKPKEAKIHLNHNRLLFEFATHSHGRIVEDVLREHKPTSINSYADYQELIIALEVPLGIVNVELLWLLNEPAGCEKRTAEYLIKVVGEAVPLEQDGKNFLVWNYHGEGISYHNKLYASTVLSLADHPKWSVTHVPFGGETMQIAPTEK